MKTSRPTFKDITLGRIVEAEPLNENPDLNKEKYIFKYQNIFTKMCWNGDNCKRYKMGLCTFAHNKRELFCKNEINDGDCFIKNCEFRHKKMIKEVVKHFGDFEKI